MADGVSGHKNILTIGFLNDQVRLMYSVILGLPNFNTLSFKDWVLTLSPVSLRWKREKTRTSTHLTSYWWRTRRWTSQTPSSDTLPHQETTSKTHKEELDSLCQHTRRCMLDTSSLTSMQTLKRDFSTPGVVNRANHTFNVYTLCVLTCIFLLCFKAIWPNSKG